MTFKASPLKVREDIRQCSRAFQLHGGCGDLFEAKELQMGLTALGIRELIDNLARTRVPTTEE